MITITAVGRLAQQPEVKLLPGGPVCEFRVLSSRYAKNEEVVEAVSFFCYDAMAEDFASRMVKGQEIQATGVQETSRWVGGNGEAKSFVRYRLTWFQPGRKPKSEYRNDSDRQDQRQGGSGAQSGYRQQGRAPARSQDGSAFDTPSQFDDLPSTPPPRAARPQAERSSPSMI
jgi:single-stranded DNA-binding protein